MRAPERTVRKATYLLLALTISAALAACGGGGGSSTSPGTSGPATVSVSIASAPGYPAGTTFATSTASPAIAAPPGNSPEFTSVFVTVTKLALIPSSGPELPDAGGEEEKSDSSEKDGDGFVTATLAEPVTIDLRNLMPDDAAMLLNRFSGVPAGEYSKIRVYYDNVVGHNADGNTTFHPTAHYHFDVHFVGGNLVIPGGEGGATIPTSPEGGIRFFSVEIKVVGLKYHEAGQSGNILLRPQVFAEVVGAPKYIVTGEAAQVNHDNNTFVVVVTVPNDNVDAEYNSDTDWYFVDGRTVGPFDISRAVALQDNALVDVIGTFQGGVLTADEVRITFPDARTGTADNVWILSDTAFTVESVTDNDNVTVFPMPDRLGAYYDNSTSQLTFAAIDNGIHVKVRGYFNDYPNLDAYWISIEP